MKKSILTFATAVALFGTSVATTQTAAHASTQTIAVYQFKKTGNHYKYISAKLVKVSKKLKKGHSFKYKNFRVYYSSTVKGYVPDSVFEKAPKAYVNKHYKPVQHHFSKVTNKPDVSVDGYNAKKETITDANAYAKAFITEFTNDVNAYRTSHGLNALNENPAMQPVANERAKQELKYWNQSWYNGHYDQNGKTYSDILAAQYNVYPSYEEASYHIAENTGTNPANSSELETPQQAAKDLLEETIEEGPTGGHYQNMMSPNTKYLTVGLTVEKLNDPSSNLGIAQEFNN
ncbi:CAP domain-containing protein [Lactobacillus sp. Sy-1]|uniref:CAP domain-containing protein n=1 Tax=Lactobacillus sp. Sy-1 TaxID=2109645 RepID=UPI001C5BE3F3|nr:CAP domain-containing protein [Lactobacillus sp. Sy-1]MBW1606097.1 hypothetical protein [Lactobacillus sp. Sy-1]